MTAYERCEKRRVSYRATSGIVKGAKHMENRSSEEIRVALPGSLAPIKLPAGWSRASEPSGGVTIVGPEGDLRVAFIICALDGTPEEIARRARKYSSCSLARRQKPGR